MWSLASHNSAFVYRLQPSGSARPRAGTRVSALGSRARQFITAHAPGRLLCTSPRKGYAFVPSRYQQTMLRGRRCSRALFACRSLSTMPVATYIAILRSSNLLKILTPSSMRECIRPPCLNSRRDHKKIKSNADEPHLLL